ncbi:MAG: hypothetical protein QXY14_04275 [Candidatus Nitrosocaldus sp.]
MNIMDAEGNYPFFDGYYGALDHFNRGSINISPLSTYYTYATDSYAQVKIHDGNDELRQHALFLSATYPQRIAAAGCHAYTITPVLLSTSIVFECAFKQLNTVQQGERLSIGLFSERVYSHDAFSSMPMIALRYDGGDNSASPKQGYEFVHRAGESGSGSTTIISTGVSRNNLYNLFRIVWSIDAIEFYMNGEMRYRATSNIPLRPLHIAFSVMNARTATALDIRVLIDYWHIYIK